MTNRINEIINSFVIDRELLFQFFAVFSRFEYAMKRCGFVKTGPRRVAQADWGEFAESLAGLFAGVEDRSLSESVAYLLGNPPKTQVVADLPSQLCWRDTTRDESESDEEFVLRLVRTVRNNLFHGGKYPYPDGSVQDVGRNRQLLESGLAILNCCLDLNPAVRESFAEAA